MEQKKKNNGKSIEKKICDYATIAFMVIIVLSCVSFFMEPTGTISSLCITLGTVAVTAYCVSAFILLYKTTKSDKDDMKQD